MQAHPSPLSNPHFSEKPPPIRSKPLTTSPIHFSQNTPQKAPSLAPSLPPSLLQARFQTIKASQSIRITRWLVLFVCSFCGILRRGRVVGTSLFAIVGGFGGGFLRICGVGWGGWRRRSRRRFCCFGVHFCQAGNLLWALGGLSLDWATFH